MFERFTENAINAIQLAQQETRALGHDFVGTEGILLGLIALNQGVAAIELKVVGITIDNAREAVQKRIGHGSGGTAPEMPFTPRAKKALEAAFEQSRQFPRAIGGTHIGTSHLLLGIISEDQSVASHVLTNLGVDLTQFRSRLVTRIRDTEAASPSELNFLQADIGKYSPPAVRVLDVAQNEARQLGHNFIGTEQILVAILTDPDSAAATALKSFGLSTDEVRSQIEQIIGRGSGFFSPQIPFSPRVRRILEGSWHHAKKLGQNFILPEHLLLALLDEAGGVAFQIFEIFNVDITTLRAKVLDQISNR